jgi:hypothetical protein
VVLELGVNDGATELGDERREVGFPLGAQAIVDQVEDNVFLACRR